MEFIKRHAGTIAMGVAWLTLVLAMLHLVASTPS